MISRILIVDDQEVWREYLEDKLSKEGREIQTAKSKKEALGILHRQTFKVIIADLRMEESDTTNIDGLLLFDEIQSQFPSDPIKSILLTGHGSLPIVRDAFKNYNVYDFIDKGVDGFEKQLYVDVENAIQTELPEDSGKFHEAQRRSVFNERMLEIMSTQLYSPSLAREIVLVRLSGFIVTNVPPTEYLPLSLAVHGPSFICSAPPTIKLICWSRSINKGLLILIQIVGQKNSQESALEELLRVHASNWEVGLVEFRKDKYFLSAIGVLTSMDFKDFEKLANKPTT